MALSKSDFEKAAADLCCEVSAIRAIDEIESRGEGFLDTGEPTILYERHWFYKLVRQVKGKQVASLWHRQHPDICNPEYGGYLGGGREHDRLQKAVGLHRGSALQSASWGRYQIMGFNWQRCGYGSLQHFINAMYASEEEHLEAFVGFVKGSGGLHAALQRKEWTRVARLYNGPAYARNRYHVKLRDAYEKYSRA